MSIGHVKGSRNPISKEPGTQLLATDAVVAGLDGLLVRDLGDFQLRGKRGATRIFELVGMGAQAFAERVKLCSEFEAARVAYEAGRLEEARTRFESLLSDLPSDGPSGFYAGALRQSS